MTFFNKILLTNNEPYSLKIGTSWKKENVLLAKCTSSEVG